ncbi:hypothetical protein HY969_02675 [Candidatus Kaiserbacteria bacterium]|nr:hypothetical protein [Candidatus Kaiserbacteria bacterium]
MSESFEKELHPEKKTLILMPLQEWVQGIKLKYPSQNQKRLAHTILSFRRTKPTTVAQARLFERGKLYPWLRDTCGIIEVQTVGDLLKVFQNAPTRNAVDAPWVWFTRFSHSPSYQRRIDMTEAALKDEGLL